MNRDNVISLIMNELSPYFNVTDSAKFIAAKNIVESLENEGLLNIEKDSQERK